MEILSSSSSNEGNGPRGFRQQWKVEWWGFLPIPIPVSWLTPIEMESNLPPPSSPPYRDRDRNREEEMSLDDTWSRYRRRYDDGQPPPSQPKIQVPFSVIVTVVFWSIAQLVGGVWWAATLQSNLEHEVVDRQKEEARLWQSIETYRLENNQLRVEVARNNTQIRNLKEEE